MIKHANKLIDTLVFPETRNSENDEKYFSLAENQWINTIKSGNINIYTAILKLGLGSSVVRFVRQ